MNEAPSSRWYWPVLGGVIILALSLALLPGLFGEAQPESIDQQVERISLELWCPVCDAQTVAESRSPAAEAMRDIIREKLTEGWSREQILDFFANEYGVGILTAPPSRGLSVIAWLIPFIGLLGGAYLIRRGIVERNTQRSAVRKAKIDSKTAKEIDDELKNYI